MHLNMPRVKQLSLQNVCADCCFQDPQWASLNRGVFVCDECCSVHRTLGRHISYVKSLSSSNWPGKSLQLVHALSNAGANSIWEHVLLDPTYPNVGVKKPSPSDSFNIKHDFIRSKYLHNAFVHRPAKEKPPGESELAQQLHASVRTDNLDTSLRLLAQGADPNILHPEKGSTPLHVAAASGQDLQVELLLIYGADPRILDVEENTPVDVAQNSGHVALVQRLQESCFEITDRLIAFLCGPKVDHSSGVHIIVPEVDYPHDQATTIVARRRLRALPDPLFEQLVQDIFDEVNRRELEEISSSSGASVPFLPVNADFSTTRNQGRQKLARFSDSEIAALIADVLSDAKRRFRSATGDCNDSDDEPLYDCVASDDDYKDLDEISTFKDSSLTEITASPSASAEANGSFGSLMSQTLPRFTANSTDELVPPRPHSMFESRSTPSNHSPNSSGDHLSVSLANTNNFGFGSRSSLRSSSLSPRRSPATHREWAPFYSAVLTQTEDITRLIHDLLVAAQEGRSEAYPDCVNSIHSCVLQMREIIPASYTDQIVRTALEDLLQKSFTLHRELEADQASRTSATGTPGVIQSAYDVAKSAKILVTSFPNAAPNTNATTSQPTVVNI